MEITNVKLTRSNVHIEYDNEGDTYKYDSADRPLPSFYKAMEALIPLILDTLMLPKAYAGKKPTEGDEEPGYPLTPTGITITLKGESRLLCITATKVIDTPAPFNITVPNRYLDAPTKEGATSIPYPDKQVAIVEDLIEEAKKYLRGERAQGVLPLETDEQAYSEPSEGKQEKFV